MCAPRERHGESVFFVTSRCCFCLVLPNRTRREGRHHCLFLSCRWGARPPSCLWGVVLCFSNRCDWVYRVVPSVVSPIMWMGCGTVCFPSYRWGVGTKILFPILWMGCSTKLWCFPNGGIGTKVVPILWMGCSTKSDVSHLVDGVLSKCVYPSCGWDVWY